MNFSIESINNSTLSTNSTSANGTLIFPIIWNSIVIPIICVFGMVTNGICIYIFLRLKLKEDLFKYMLASSCLCFLYLFMCFFSFSFRCSSLCAISSTYVTRLYHYYIFLYATSIFAISKAFIELVICLERYFAMKNLLLSRKISYKLVLLIIFVFSTFIYTTSLLDNQILAVPSSNNSSEVSYIVTRSTMGQTKELKALVITTSCIRGPVILFALFLLDILSTIEFRRISKRKCDLTLKTSFKNSSQVSQQTKMEKAEINLTKLVITSSFLFIVCNFPFVATIIMNTMNFNTTLFFTYFALFSHTLLFIYHGLNFFVYYKFNKKFRNFFQRKHPESKLILIENVLTNKTPSTQ